MTRKLYPWVNPGSQQWLPWIEKGPEVMSIHNKKIMPRPTTDVCHRLRKGQWWHLCHIFASMAYKARNKAQVSSPFAFQVKSLPRSQKQVQLMHLLNLKMQNVRPRWNLKRNCNHVLPENRPQNSQSRKHPYSKEKGGFLGEAQLGRMRQC